VTRLFDLLTGPLSPALAFTGTLVVPGRPLAEALDTFERLHEEVSRLFSPTHAGVPARLITNRFSTCIQVVVWN
jgi:hypothetical protein